MFPQKEDITLLQALELERLIHKSRNERIYQTELLELEDLEGYPPNTIIDLSENTTVTKMERRIFDMSIQNLQNNCRINTPANLYLNFFEHLSYQHKGMISDYDKIDINHYLRRHLEWIETSTHTEIAVLGTGPKNNERILKKQILRGIRKE